MIHPGGSPLRWFTELGHQLLINPITLRVDVPSGQRHFHAAMRFVQVGAIAEPTVTGVRVQIGHGLRQVGWRYMVQAKGLKPGESIKAVPKVR